MDGAADALGLKVETIPGAGQDVKQTDSSANCTVTTCYELVAFFREPGVGRVQRLLAGMIGSMKIE
jgi:hypothetical protein